MFSTTLKLTLLFGLILSGTFSYAGVIVEFRMDATDVGGNVLDFLTVDQDFNLNVYTRDVRDSARGGVFAAYMDVTYDPSTFQIAGPVKFGDLYGNGKRQDLTTTGILNDIGAFSSGLPGQSPFAPIGIGEHLVFSVPLKAIQAGEFAFIGSAAMTLGLDVLVFGENAPTRPEEIDFNSNANARSLARDVNPGAVAYSAFSGSVVAVPEPSSFVLLAIATVGLGLHFRRK